MLEFLKSLIPTDLLSVGATAFVVCALLVFVDVPGKGVPWDKVGAWFAILGGFGVGGRGAGEIGSLVSNLAHGAQAAALRFTAAAFGVGLSSAALIAAGIWAYSRAQGKGISTKSKLKSLGLATILAGVGALVAFVPGLYSALNEFWSGTVGQAAR